MNHITLHAHRITVNKQNICFVPKRSRWLWWWWLGYISDGLVQEIRNSSALAMELRLS